MEQNLIYDWNEVEPRPKPLRVLLDDETLRDGLQSPSVRSPTPEQKIEILHLIDELGIDTADIGLPGAGPHVVRDVERQIGTLTGEGTVTIKARAGLGRIGDHLLERLR